MSELNEVSVTKWQSEWDLTTKGAITKSFFPNIAERLKQKINGTSNFTTMVTGHGNIKKNYIHTYIRTYMHTYMHAYIHTYTHTYIPTYIHTYIHTHTYTHT